VRNEWRNEHLIKAIIINAFPFSAITIAVISLSIYTFLSLSRCAIRREIRQKEIYKMIIDTNPLYINKFFRTVSALNLLIPPHSQLTVVAKLLVEGTASFNLCHGLLSFHLTLPI
jgi:hypothetical protein